MNINSTSLLYYTGKTKTSVWHYLKCIKIKEIPLTYILNLSARLM